MLPHENIGGMAVIDQLLAEATTAKNTALLEQLRGELDDHWRYPLKFQCAVPLSETLLY
jgi:hypothetical protein